MTYYVYTHSTENGEVKYVGSGTRQRAEDSGNRSIKWKELFSNQKFIIDRIVKNLTKDEARQLEIFFINKYRSTVINKVSVSVTKEMVYEDFCELFEINYASPTGLVHKVDNNGTGLNKRRKGDNAGTLRLSRGKYYWYVKLSNHAYACHRIVFLLHHKCIDSDLVINHIDGDSKNNNIGNLEQVTTAENNRQKSLVSKSGYVNIHENTREGVFRGYTFKGEVYGGHNKYFSIAEYKNRKEALAAAVKYKEEFLKGLPIVIKEHYVQ